LTFLLLPLAAQAQIPAAWLAVTTDDGRLCSMQNPVYPGATPVPLPMEEPLVLRYRLVVHRGAGQMEQIDRWQWEFGRRAGRG
jgi:hypothetical protein